MDNQTTVGSLGELLIKQYYESKGRTVILSEDKFDSEKDMLIDGHTVEVKTQVPWFMKKWLTFSINQEHKMRKVDLLYVIGYNSTNDKRFDIYNKIWLINNSFKTNFYTNPKTGKQMFGIAIDDPAVTVVATLPVDTVKKFTKYTSSSFMRIT